MATSKTGVGKNIEAYLDNIIDRSTKGADAAQQAGYPAQSSFTDAYYAGIPGLAQYGDPELASALSQSQGLYGLYGQAGGYNRTDFSDLENLFAQGGDYDPANFGLSDCTAQNIMQRMSPYEELVSGRAKDRLKKSYDQARGERETAALRAGAFGGSGAAVQEELARRGLLEQMSDLDVQNLQSAFESGIGLYSKEMADNLAAQSATEQSRQFGKQVEMSGLEGVMTARQQQAAQEAAAKEAQFKGLAGQTDSVQQAAALAEQKKNMQLANLAASQQAGQQQEQRLMDQRMYPLNLAQSQANILGAVQGSTTPLPSTKQQTSMGQNILGGITAGLGIYNGLGGASGIGSLFGGSGGLYAAGGVVMPRGGLADIALQEYQRYGHA
jgi:hypothetical protein